MPLNATYGWDDDEENVIIRVPLKGTPSSKLDIFLTSVLIKVYFSPYLLLLDIAIGKEIDSCNPNNSATIIDGVLKLVIKKGKSDRSRWTELVIPLEEQRNADIVKRRDESIEKKTAQEAELVERRKDRRFQEERRLLRSQMALDAARQQKLDDIKDEEKEQAVKDVYDTLDKFHQQHWAAVPSSDEKNDSVDIPVEESIDRSDDEEVDGVITGEPQQQLKESSLKDIIHEETRTRTTTNNELDEQQSKSEAAFNVKDDDYIAEEKDENTMLQQPVKNRPVEHKSSYIPVPRKSASIEVEFTPRLFPTPLRESKVQDEDNWIIRNREHLSSNAVLNEYRKGNGYGDNTACNTSPAWLKSKGDDFYRSGDYHSALNAYSALLEATNGKDVAALSNRAACQLKLGHWKQVVDDCTEALCLMDSERSCSSSVEDNNKRQRLLVRRGTALSRQGLFQLALDDYRSALTCCPDDEEIIRDTGKRLLGWLSPALLRSDSNLHCGFLTLILTNLERMDMLVLSNGYKQRADCLVENGSFQEAIALYGQAIDTTPTHVACLSNRAACFLALEQNLKCVNDCTSALKIMQYQSTKSHIESFSLLIPSINSSKGHRWVASTLTRRAVALERLGNVKQAICDIKEAISFAPEDNALKGDMSRLKSLQLQE